MILAQSFKKGGKPSKEDMPCNKPRKSWRAGKKKVVKACEGGKEKLVHYGFQGMEDYTQHGSKKRRKSYCARSGGIKGTKNKLSANYWARKDLWSCAEGGTLTMKEGGKTKKKWIPKDLKKGAFTSYCKSKGYEGVTNECIAEGKKSSNPTTVKRATLANTFRNMRKKQGGDKFTVTTAPPLIPTTSKAEDGLYLTKTITRSLDRYIYPIKLKKKSKSKKTKKK